MNILYCLHSLYNSGGMERVLTLKANYLASELGYAVHIITTEQKGRDVFYPLDNRIQYSNFSINFNDDISILHKLVNRYSRLAEYKKQLVTYIVDNKIDVCISLGWKEVTFLQDLSKYCKVVCERHFAINAEMIFAQNHYSSKIIANVIGRISTYILLKKTRNLDAVVVLTKEDKKVWEKTHRNIRQIYNPSPYPVSDDRTELLNKRFIAVGRLEPQKGYDYLIRACVPVLKKYTDWQVDIYGEGTQRSYLQELIDSNELNGRVNLKGVSKNIAKHYLSSSGFLMSSRYEGFPMVLLEAASFGLPLISFDCVSGPKEIIKSGYNGILVPFEDTEALSEAMELVICNDKLRTQLGENSIAVAKEFTVERIMEKWDILFKSLIEKA